MLRHSFRYWLDLGPDDVHWTISDTGWAKCAYGCLFGPWNQGACVFIYNSQFEPRNVLKILEKYPISTLCLPPTGYRMMVQHDMKQFRFPSLRHCLSAGEPINPEVMDEWKQGTGLEIREGYGQTETVRIDIAKTLPVMLVFARRDRTLFTGRRE